MFELTIIFQDGTDMKVPFNGNAVGIFIKEVEETPIPDCDKGGPRDIKDKELEPTPPSLKGFWRTDEHFIVHIYELHESKKYWLAKCKEVGGGKDVLIYSLDGSPVNYPEFGKIMNRLDGTFSFGNQGV